MVWTLTDFETLLITFMCFPCLFLDSKHSILLIIILSDFCLCICHDKQNVYIQHSWKPSWYVLQQSFKTCDPCIGFLYCKTLTFTTGTIFLISHGFGSISLTFKPSSKRHKISQRMKFNFFWAYSCIISSKYQVSIFTKKELSILTWKWQRLSLVCTPYTVCAKWEMVQHRNLTSQLLWRKYKTQPMNSVRWKWNGNPPPI